MAFETCWNAHDALEQNLENRGLTSNIKHAFKDTNNIHIDRNLKKLSDFFNTI